jgi:RHS repeat-associated protein
MDANALLYLRARYYRPALGVFPSLDPVEGNVQQPMSLNRYEYVQGNVINQVDPSGLILRSPITWDMCQPEDVDICPISGRPPFLGRCWFFYSSGDAQEWALDLNKTNTERQQYTTDFGGAGTYCSVFMFYVITSGGMPVLFDAPPETGYDPNLGLCSPLESTDSNCRFNARDADSFVMRYLKRGCTDASCEPITGTPEAFWPPVQNISETGILPGDLIYQSRWDIGTPHISMFIGWGPDLSSSWDDLDEWYKQVDGNFITYITDQQQFPERIWWVIDDVSRPLENVTQPYARPFDMPGRAVRGVHIVRIPPIISISLGYLKASQ